MKTHYFRQGSQGFSLLEVLIAIVILSVGLLALASLQLSLIRSSNDTKAQSTALSLAKEQIERIAAYQIMGGSTTSCYSPIGTPVSGQSSCYRAITDVGATAVDGDPAVTGNQAIGGVNYTRQTTISRYVFNKSTNLFELRSDVALDSALRAISTSILPGKEYKKVLVTVAWVDAGGITRRIQLEDAVSGIAPADSLAVSTTSDTIGPRQAQRNINTSAMSMNGVIPIALGDGSETAATNPRPVIVSQGNSSETIETRFDVYTYAAISSSAAQVQSQVQTAVVGCKCNLSSGTQTAFRPTYWDGFGYKAPVTVNTMPVSTEASGNITQSDLCTACCRDHHDPSGVAAPKYDPRRTTHNHYLATDLASPVTTGEYNEACRLIRVDGFFRVAAEPYDDHYGLLKTAGLGASTPTTTLADAIPNTGTGSSTALYQAYVLNYLNQRFVTGTAYNTTLTPSAVTGYSALEAPSSASITSSSSPQYMHSRGLLIDHLHTDAIAAITSAKANCLATGCNTQETQTAVLKLLPFTSINLTELAKWQSSNSAKVGVSLAEDLAATLTSSLPISGRANYNSGVDGDTVTATTTMQRTSAGLAIVDKIFPDSELTDSILSDTQLFTIGAGGNNGTFPGGEIFSVVLDGSDLLTTLAIGNPVQVSFGDTTFKSCTPNGSTVTPFTCTTDTTFGLGGAANVKVGNYNRSGSVTVQNSCTRHSNAGNNLNSDTTTMPYVSDFDVSSVAVDGNAGTISQVINSGLPGVSGEYTVVAVSPVNVNSTVTVSYGTRTYKCPSNYATFITNSGDDAGKTPDDSNSSTVCTGNGNNKVPVWDQTTWVACPGTPLQ